MRDILERAAPARRAGLRRRILNLPTDVELEINGIEYWNQQHSDDSISSAFERAMLAHFDGHGPMPEVLRA